MGRSGGACSALVPPLSSPVDQLSAAAAVRESTTNCQVFPAPEKINPATSLHSTSPTVATVANSYSGIPGGSSSSSIPHSRRTSFSRSQTRRSANGKQKHLPHGKVSTVSSAWDALVDTFSQCYYTLRQDERGCHALSPPVSTPPTVVGNGKKKVLGLDGASATTALQGDAGSRQLAIGRGNESDPHSLPAATTTEKGGTKVAVCRSSGSLATVAATSVDASNRVGGPASICSGPPSQNILALVPFKRSSSRQLILCPVTKGDLQIKCSLSAPTKMKDAAIQLQTDVAIRALTAFPKNGTQSSAFAGSLCLLPLGDEKSSTRRKGVVSDAEVLDRLTRRMIADLQHHFTVRNGAVSAAEFVFIFKQVFNGRNSQAKTGTAGGTAAAAEAARSATGALGIVLPAALQFGGSATRGTELCTNEEVRRQREHLFLFEEDQIKGSNTLKSTRARSVEDLTTKGATAVQDIVPLLGACSSSALVKHEDDGGAEKVLVSGNFAFNSVLAANEAAQQLVQQHQREKELLETHQLLDAFALIDVNDKGIISWEQFTRFIIDRGRNEDMLKRLHLQRLERRDIKDCRPHLTPVQSFTVAYDPPLSLDVVFYFEENSKTVEVLTPDVYPCSVSDSGAACLQLPSSNTVTPVTRVLHEQEHMFAFPVATTLSPGANELPEGAAAASAAHLPLASAQLPRDSVVLQGVPLNFPIRHTFTITAIAYCPSVQHLAVAAADLTLSFYDARQAGLSSIRQQQPTEKTHMQSPTRLQGLSSVPAAADGTDRRSDVALSGEETSCWKMICSFKTRTSQIILYPSPAHPLLFSADHEGSIFAWDLLRICKPESENNGAHRGPQWWRNPTEKREDGSGPSTGADNSNGSPPFPFPLVATGMGAPASTSVLKKSLVTVEVSIIKERRKAMRFGDDVIVAAPIDLATLIYPSRPQQQISGRTEFTSDTAANSKAALGGEERGRIRRMVVTGGPPSSALGGSTVQTDGVFGKKTGSGASLNVPPLKLPALQAKSEGGCKTNYNDVGARFCPLTKRVTTLQRSGSGQAVDDGNAGSPLSSNRSDHLSGDYHSSGIPNDDRSLSSASGASRVVLEGKKRQLDQQSGQCVLSQFSNSGEQSKVGLVGPYTAWTTEAEPGRTGDSSFSNSSAIYSTASVVHRGSGSGASFCSSLAGKAFSSGAFTRRLRHHQQQTHEKSCSLSASPRSPSLARATAGNGANLSRCSETPSKPTRIFDHPISSPLPDSNSTGEGGREVGAARSGRSRKRMLHSTQRPTISCGIDRMQKHCSHDAERGTSTITDDTDEASYRQRSAGSKKGTVLGLWREQTAGKNPGLSGVPSDFSTERDPSGADAARSTNRGAAKTVHENLQRICSSASTCVSRKGAGRNDGSHMVTKLDQQEEQRSDSPLHRLDHQQQAAEQTALPRDGRSHASNRMIAGLPRPCALTDRLGTAPSEPQNHLLRWRQLHAHSDIVSGFQELEGGTDMLASCGMDKRIILWSVSTGERKRVLEGHVRGIRALCFDVESRALLSGGFDYKLFVWNPYVGKKVHTIRGHSAPVVSICMLAGGGRTKRQFLSCDSEGIIKTWDLSSSACLQTLLAEDLLPSKGGQLRALVALPHRQMLLAAAGRKVVALVYGTPTNATADRSNKLPSSPHRGKLQRNVTAADGPSFTCNMGNTSTCVEARDRSGKAGRRTGGISGGGDGLPLSRKATSSDRAATGRTTRSSGIGAAKRGTSALNGVLQDSGKFTGVADICKGLPREGEPLTKAVAHTGVRVLVTAGATNLRVWDLCTGILISSISHDCTACSSTRVGCGSSKSSVTKCTGRISEATDSTCTQRVGSANCQTASLDPASRGYKKKINRIVMGLSSTAESRNGTGRPTSGLVTSTGDGLPRRAALDREAPQGNKPIISSEAEVTHLITDICLDRSGRKVFVADHFGCLCAYSVCTGQIVRRLAPHAAEISHLVYAGEDRNLISVSWDRSIVVHNDAPSATGVASTSSPSFCLTFATSTEQLQHAREGGKPPLSVVLDAVTPSRRGSGYPAVSNIRVEQQNSQVEQRKQHGKTAGDLAPLRNVFASSINNATECHARAARYSAVGGKLSIADETSVNGRLSNASTSFSSLLQDHPRLGAHCASSGNSPTSSQGSSSHAHSLRFPSQENTQKGSWKSNCTLVEEEREEETSGIWRRVDNAHLGDVTCCAYSRRLALVATGGVDKAIFIWTYERLRRIACLFGHREDVAVLTFADPLPFLCSADIGGTICVWVLPPHPRAVRVLEMQSASLSCIGRSALLHTSTAETAVAAFSRDDTRHILLHDSATGGTVPTGTAHNGSPKQNISYPDEQLRDGSPSGSKQVACRSAINGSVSALDNSSNSSRESTLCVSDVGGRLGKNCGKVAAVNVAQQATNVMASVALPQSPPSPGYAQERTHSSRSSRHTPPSRPPSGSFSCNTVGGFAAGECAMTGASCTTRYSVGAFEAADANNAYHGIAAQDPLSCTPCLESNSAGIWRSPPAFSSTDTIEGEGTPATLLLVKIEDMADITGTIPVVSLAAICRRRRENTRGFPPTPAAETQTLLSLAYANERDQPQRCSSVFRAAPDRNALAIPAAFTAESSEKDGESPKASRPEREQRFPQDYVSKSTTFITSADTSEGCFNQLSSCLAHPALKEQQSTSNEKCPSSSKAMQTSSHAGSGMEMGVLKSRKDLQRSQFEGEQNKGNRRHTQKKKRTARETVSRLRQQQQVEEARAKRDACWPQEAEFLLFAGDEQGCVRVWDVSFILRQLKGTHYIRKKKDWNPYRIWREELKESTLNIFRERMQQQRQQQQHLTQVLEQEEDAEEELRASGSTSEGRGQVYPGGTGVGLRGTRIPESVARTDGVAGVGEGAAAAFSLPTRRMPKKTYETAKTYSSNSGNSNSEGPMLLRNSSASPVETVSAGHAGNALTSSHAASTTGRKPAQDDACLGMHMRKKHAT